MEEGFRVERVRERRLGSTAPSWSCAVLSPSTALLHDAVNIVVFFRAGPGVSFAVSFSPRTALTVQLRHSGFITVHLFASSQSASARIFDLSLFPRSDAACIPIRSIQLLLR
ncbi:hypothetical protein PIB30_092990 [Stylosanthes scabra]|uniref:Uncharacterized protein n=1 Tax=Stylosanthes scabra TaxID=79078 RepID=A0ABU6TVK0_9FABA|nr:hypothetical protein [Stylosanthes scabra]